MEQPPLPLIPTQVPSPTLLGELPICSPLLELYRTFIIGYQVDFDRMHCGTSGIKPDLQILVVSVS